MPPRSRSQKDFDPKHFDGESSLAGLDLQETDALLSRDLMKLSFKDRNNITEEIHGVHSLSVDENPQIVDAALTQLQYEIKSLPTSQKGAYSVAQTLPVTYVNDSAFRLRFLRAELFDARLATERMMSYLDMIMNLFGVEVLKRPLRTTDFKTKEEKSLLKSGIAQLLPYRDRSGRRVMVILSDIMSHSHIMRVKIFLYLMTVAGECEETQRNGVVWVLWPGQNSNLKVPSPVERDVCNKSYASMPLRLAGFHFCWPDTPFFRFIRSFFVLVIGPKIRVRVNFHMGEHQELAYKLMGFGIPVQLLPTTGSGAIKTKNYAQWLKTRQLLEKHAFNSPTTQPANLVGAIECPPLNDVLYERTKPCNFHPGNSRFKGLIEERKEEHTQLSQTEKRNFAWSIVEEIEKRNGRFLTWDRKGGFWVQLRDRSEIRQKVATSLRDFNKHSRAVAKVQTVASVCKVSFDDGQLLKKRRVVVSDDESSEEGLGNCRGHGSSNSSVCSGGGACHGECLSSVFDFKPSFDFKPTEFDLETLPIRSVSTSTAAKQ